MTAIQAIADLIDATLKAATPLGALVSTRIYEDLIPENGAYPAVTYSVDDGAAFQSTHVEDSGAYGVSLRVFDTDCTPRALGPIVEQVCLALENQAFTQAGYRIRFRRQGETSDTSFDVNVHAMRVVTYIAWVGRA